MVVEIPSISNERYKTKSTVYINILTNKIDVLNDEEGNVVNYSTINVPVLITQCISLNDDTTIPLVAYMEPFNKIEYVKVEDSWVANNIPVETFVYNEEAVVEALTKAINKKL
jgi:hypothetical protein